MILKKLSIVWTIVFSLQVVFGQEADSSYVKSYPQKIRLMGYVSTSFIQVDDGDHLYTPNYPLNTGVGLVIKNTVFGVQAGYGFIPLKNQKQYGKSRSTDLQLHNYGRKMILDLYLQSYRGFYVERKVGEVENVFPDMSVMQIGGEATWIFNGKHFSSKAAFDLNEIQLRSAGSWLLGGGAYYYRIRGLEYENTNAKDNFENLQLGLNAGYAYSWVINDRWMLSGMVKGGVNFGNTPKLVQKADIEIYPTAFARFAGNYHKKDWGVSMVVLIGNRSVYPLKNAELSLTTVTMQLSYVKHIDYLFKKKDK